MWRYGLIYENVRDNGIWHGNWYGGRVVRSLIRVSRTYSNGSVLGKSTLIIADKKLFHVNERERQMAH